MKTTYIVSEYSKYDKTTENFILSSRSLNKKFSNKNCIFLEELIVNEKGLHEQTEFILKKYTYYKKLLSDKLNLIHNTSLTEKFWTKAFNLYLIRLIMAQWIRFNKFNKFNPLHHDAHVLKKDLYYYAIDTPDSIVNLLNSNFYQEQIFSIYINIFYPDFNLKQTAYQMDILEEAKYPKKYDFSQLKFSKTTILDTHIDNFKMNLNNKINHFYMPKLDISGFNISNKQREQLDFEDFLFIDDFDKFFLKSLKFLLPKSYLEAFRYIYETYDSIDISEAKYILCENWLSNDKLSIFLAIAKEKNVKHYSLEHGHTHYFKNNYALFSHSMVDKYISYGWKDSFISNLIPTGMWRLNPDKKYDGKTHESNVLFVCYGNVFLYDTDFLACHYINNSAQENYYNNIKTLMESISQNYAKQITYKEYPKFRGKDRGFNNEYNHIFKNCKILTNEQELGYGNLKFIDTCKLVIVGNIGTVFFETLYHGAPTIALYSKDHAFVEKQYIDLFQQLEEVGILQTCPYKMAKLIENVIDDPIVWWNSEKVIYARNNFIDKYSSPRDKFYNFLDEL